MRSLVIVGAVFVAGLLAGRLARSGWLSDPAVTAGPPIAPPPAAEGRNGLTDTERQTFYHLSEGGELFPADWLAALEVETTGAGGTIQARPFLDNIERYGLLSDAPGARNPFGLPVGITLARGKGTGIEMIGLNCTACHVGQVEYKGHAVRIDGGPNMVLINRFLQDLGEETRRTLTSPRRLGRFWDRVRAVRRARRANSSEAQVLADDERIGRQILGLFTRNRDLLEAKVQGLRLIPVLQHSLAISTQEGYGRLDAFGIGRDELFGGPDATGRANSLPANGPVSFPHIWGMEYTGWLQWGANTNSVMERNIGQALGVGATVISKVTYESTVRLDNLHELEELAYKITPPKWPDSFPAIDSAKAEQGRALFQQYCAGCHETFQTDGRMRTYQLFSLAEVGTDPMTAINFELPVETRGAAVPFPYAALDLITKIKQRAYEDEKFDARKIAAFEQRQIRSGPQWDPTFRAPLLDSEKWPDTKGRKVYRAKTLVGIWATAPYLHNGSVPTIYDLLTPAARRPVTFPTGQREYDPIKLGIQTDPSRFAFRKGLDPFLMDTRLPGNWNSGHEWSFYPSLTDDMRYAIIEFLKTYTGDSTAGSAAGTTRLADMAPIQALTDLPLDGAAASRSGMVLFLLSLAVSIALAVGTFRVSAERHGATEQADIAAIVKGILVLQARYAAVQDRPPGRGTHVKGRAAHARFEVFDLSKTVPDRSLANRLAIGLYAKPGIYPATVRFANGSSQIFPDRNRDVRACSFSVELPPGVAGPAAGRQDFTMNNATTFPINDAHAFAALVRVVTASSMAKGVWSLPFRDKLGFVRTLVLGALQQRPPKRAYQQTRYWSTVPYRHGPADVVKYSAIPCAGNAALPLSDDPNALQDELVRHLENDEQMSCFDFGLQFLDTERMTHWGRRRDTAFWIENGSVEWNERQSPFHIVARLTLTAKSAFTAEESGALYIDVTEHSTADSEPLGSLNRARWAPESASRKARQGSA